MISTAVDENACVCLLDERDDLMIILSLPQLVLVAMHYTIPERAAYAQAQEPRFAMARASQAVDIKQDSAGVERVRLASCIGDGTLTEVHDDDDGHSGDCWFWW